jgi:hypothetical protein
VSIIELLAGVLPGSECSCVNDDAMS